MRHPSDDRHPSTPAPELPATDDSFSGLNDSRPLVKTEDVLGNLSQVPPITVPHPIASLYQVMVPILLSACLLSLLANSAIVCSARWIRRRRLSPNLFLSLSLAAADAFASLVVGLGLVLNSLLPVALSIRLDERFDCLLLGLEALRLGSLVSTALHLLALAANHHVGIARPLHYGHIVTRRTTKVSAAAIWGCPFAFFLAYFWSVPGDGFQSRGCSSHDFLARLPFRATVGALFFAPLLAMAAIYGHIFAIVRQPPQSSATPCDRLLRRKVRATVTTLLILMAYVAGWMPAVLYFVVTCLDCPAPFPSIPLGVRVPVGFATNGLVVARTLVDPALYLVRMPEVREALRTMVGMGSPAASSGHSSRSNNARTEVRRMTLLTSQRKLQVLANGGGRVVATCGREDAML